MIQRIQSVYLLLATICTALVFGFSVAEIVDAEYKEYVFTAMEIKGSSAGNTDFTFSPIGVTILTALIATLSLVSIFMFKKRMRQKRIGRFNILLMIGLVGLMYYYANYSLPTRPEMVSYSFHTVLLPLVAAIFTLLANRRIQKDENLVRSVDRIR